uniref:Uncharacterized protein n=1 Tax=Magnetococcus massalia (strain MO-1) TaxID=451514 RepID=A0A1S7LMI2_MAGMO|nr:Exported protein of unknown function [Candidatus Magnetococcus massalia]
MKPLFLLGYLSAGRGWLFAVVGMLWLAPALHAEEHPWSQGEALFKAGQLDEALIRLQALEAEAGGEIAYDLILAQVLMAKQRWVRARFTIERVLIMQPEHAQAKRLLQQIRQHITLDRRTTHWAGSDKPVRTRINGHFRLGVGYDSNATQGPNTQMMIFPTIDHLGSFDLGNIAQEEDPYAMGGMIVAFSHQLKPQWSAIGSLELDRKLQQQRTDLREDSATLRLGIVRRLQGKHQLGVVGLGHLWRVGGERFRNSLGGLVVYNHKLAEDQGVSLSYQYLDYVYPNDRELDGNQHQVSLQYRQRWGGKLPGAASLTTRWRERNIVDVDLDVTATNAYVAFNGLGLQLEGSLELNRRLSLHGGLGWEYRWHDEMLPLYFDDQRDREISGSLALGWLVKPDWRLFLGASYTDNDSNQAVFDHDRVIFSLTSRWYFDHELH